MAQKVFAKFPNALHTESVLRDLPLKNISWANVVQIFPNVYVWECPLVTSGFGPCEFHFHVMGSYYSAASDCRF